MQWWTGVCMVSTIHINSDINEPSLGYQISISIKHQYFGGYVKVREFLYTRVIIRINTIMNHVWY